MKFITINFLAIFIYYTLEYFYKFFTDDVSIIAMIILSAIGYGAAIYLNSLIDL